MDLGLSWDIIISYDRLLTGFWLLPLNHLDAVCSVSFTPEVLSCALCLKHSPDFLPSHGMKAKVLTVSYKDSSRLSPSAPCSLCSIHTHLLIILPSPWACPFSGWRGGAIVFISFIPWVLAQLYLSLPWGLCSNITLLIGPFYMNLYNTVTPHHHSLGILYFPTLLNFSPLYLSCLTVSLLSVSSPLNISFSHGVPSLWIVSCLWKCSMKLC